MHPSQCTVRQVPSYLLLPPVVNLRYECCSSCLIACTQIALGCVTGQILSMRSEHMPVCLIPFANSECIRSTCMSCLQSADVWYVYGDKEMPEVRACDTASSLCDVDMSVWVCGSMSGVLWR